MLMDQMTWPEWKEKVAAGAPILIPVGSTEQHGPQLPLGTDVVIPRSICQRVAPAIGAIVAPAIAYGYKSHPKSGGGQAFPGTTSLDAHTLALVIHDIVCDLGQHGARRIALINGHFENAWPIVEGLNLAMRDLKRDGITDMVLLRLELGDFLYPETLTRIFPNGFPGTELEHASLLETSLMLALSPDLVRQERIPTDGPAKFPLYDRLPFDQTLVPPSGVLADARGSRAEIGEWMLRDHEELVTKALREGFGLS
ncbi:creatininase [Acidocella aminolytica]|nr:creatininase [Acidocella aminolytica]